MTIKLLQKKVFLWLLFILCACGAQAQTGNHVFSGGEANNFGVIDLSTPSGQTWSTERQALPGYFSGFGGASYTGASDASNVNGYVKHYADATNQTFSFPVGSGTDYRSLSVSGSRTAASVIATAWIVGDPNTNLDPTSPFSGSHPITSVGSGIQAISNAGQWDWQDISNDAAGVTVTVSIPDLSAFGAATDLRLVGWDGTAWVNLSGGTGASANTENSSLSGTMIAGITAIGIGKTSSSIQLSAKVFLQGAGTLTNSPFTAIAGGLMRADITALLPLVEPYTDLGLAPTQANVGTPIFSGTGNDAIVDWILVELRSTSSSSTVLARKAGLLQKDGDIVDIDGVSPISFTLTSGSYYIAIRHRNHLGVMTASTVTLSSTTSTVDFTLPTTTTHGTNAQAVISGKNYLWAGNANRNTNIIAQGSSSDRSTTTNGAVSYVNNTLGVNTYILNGYLATDVNMDGKTIAKGSSADNTIILNIVLGYPLNTTGTNSFIIQQQLP